VRYLILADIHGNREALEAVLAQARGRYDQIVCLGDLVGYGADPDFNASPTVGGGKNRGSASKAPRTTFGPGVGS
jgi:predicted phosphodiesterase